MGCFKEICTEQMDNFNTSKQLGFSWFHDEHLRVEIDPKDLDILLADEKDEFTLSLFRHPEDSTFKAISLELLS